MGELARSSRVRRGRRCATAALLSLATVVAGMAATASGRAESEPPLGFTISVSCSPDGVHHSKPTHICQQGDQLRMSTRYGGVPVEYAVCVQFGGGSSYCGSRQTTVPGESSIVTMPSKGFVGNVTVSWQINGSGVAKYEMRFVRDPVVPPFGISPLIVSGEHRLFGFIARHVAPGLSVRAWRVCDHGCPLRLRLVSQHGETRRYRVVGPRRNASFALGDVLWIRVSLPNQGRIWSRIYQGMFVRDRHGGPGDTAIRRLGPPLCAPPGLPELTRRCSKVRDVHAPLD